MIVRSGSMFCWSQEQNWFFEHKSGDYEWKPEEAGSHSITGYRYHSQHAHASEPEDWRTHWHYGWHYDGDEPQCEVSCWVIPGRPYSSTGCYTAVGCPAAWGLGQQRPSPTVTSSARTGNSRLHSARHSLRASGCWNYWGVGPRGGQDRIYSWGADIEEHILVMYPCVHSLKLSWILCQIQNSLSCPNANECDHFPQQIISVIPHIYLHLEDHNWEGTLSLQVDIYEVGTLLATLFMKVPCL